VDDTTDRCTPRQPRHRGVAAARRPEPEEASPQIVANGHEAIAEQILHIAFDRGITVRTDQDLAEILAALEGRSEVPAHALATVSAILSYLYRANRQFEPEDASWPQP
jgi:flagellar biosynthesis protein